MARPVRTSAISTIAFIFVASLLATLACAARTAAHPAPRRATGATVEATVPGRLLPGSTATVELTVAYPSAHARPSGEIVLEGIGTDPRHAGCPTSVGGPDADFSMPPVRIDDGVASGEGTLKATGHLTMHETGTDQDACRGARLTLSFGIS